MNDDTKKRDHADEDILPHDVADEALEAAGVVMRGARITYDGSPLSGTRRYCCYSAAD